MNDNTTVTLWIQDVRRGDERAAQKIWERYSTALAGLARKKLAASKRREADEHDVVQEAFAAFFRAAQADRLPQLADRDDLWRLLVSITENKARDQLKQQRRKKRGGGLVRGESVYAVPNHDRSAAGMDQSAGPDPTPEFAAQTIEECRRLLHRLPDDQLRKIVLLKLEGYTREEIAERLHCVPETIGRKLRLIRSTWNKNSMRDGS